MEYNKIIILLVVVLIAIVAVGALFLTNPMKQDSKIDVITNTTLHTGSAFLVKLTDLNNASIANESLSIVILDNSGNVVLKKSVDTNDNGEASLELVNISEGNYSVNITFDGNDEFKSCSILHRMELTNLMADVISQDASVPVDTGAFYSEQAGRTIYTGEVQLAPDDHYWRHLGNNEWERID